MTQPVSLQLYLERPVSDSELIAGLSRLLGFGIESIDHPSDDAVGFLTTKRYDRGFRTGAHLAWSARHGPSVSPQALAAWLARHFLTRVATDLPESHPSYLDPYVWFIAEPDGSAYVAAEQTDSEGGDPAALVLDEQRRSPVDG